MDWAHVLLCHRKEGQELILSWGKLGVVPVALKMSQHSMAHHPLIKNLRPMDINSFKGKSKGRRSSH